MTAIGLGSEVTFRYVSPGPRKRDARGRWAAHSIPLIMVLTPLDDRGYRPLYGRDGMIHALKLRYLSPIHLQQLRYYFTPEQQRQEMPVNPFVQQKQEHYQRQLKWQERREELQKQETGYVVRPDPNSATFGVSTFERTASAIIGAARGAFGALKRFMPFGGNEPPPPPPEEASKQHLAPMGVDKTPRLNDPYAFYHQYIKQLLGADAKVAYRKYNPAFMQNMQIIRNTAFLRF